MAFPPPTQLIMGSTGFCEERGTKSQLEKHQQAEKVVILMPVKMSYLEADQTNFSLLLYDGWVEVWGGLSPVNVAS